MGLANTVISKMKTAVSAVCGRTAGPNLVPAMVTVNVVPVAVAANNQVTGTVPVAVAANNQVAGTVPVAVAANDQGADTQGTDVQVRLAKRTTKCQPKFPKSKAPKFGLIQTDREMTKSTAKVFQKFYDGLKDEISNGPKELAIHVRDVYSRAGEDTPDWLMTAHGLKAKAPGSASINTEHYYVFGSWVPSETQAKQLAKYIGSQTDEDWNALPPEATARYLTDMKKVIKIYKAAEKQAARDGTEIPDDIQQSMRWNQEDQEENDGAMEEDAAMADQEEDDGSMGEDAAVAESEGAESSEGSEGEEDGSTDGSEYSEEEDLDTKPKARVSMSP